MHCMQPARTVLLLRYRTVVLSTVQYGRYTVQLYEDCIPYSRDFLLILFGTGIKVPYRRIDL